MDKNPDLQKQTRSGHPRVAYDALIRLGGNFENGTENVPLDRGRAFDIYERAGKLVPNRPEAYLGLSRICLWECVKSDDLTLKADYAVYARVTCDPSTLEKFGWPEIPLYVGLTLKHMAEAVEKNRFPQEMVSQYYAWAADVLSLGMIMGDVNGTTAPSLCLEVFHEISKNGFGPEPVLQEKLDLG